MYLKRAACIMILFFAPGICGAQDAAVEERLRRLESRVVELEKKVVEQQCCMKDQERCIAEQKEKIDGYERRLGEMEGRLHRQVSGEAVVVDSLRIGAGITAVAQGMDNATAGEDTGSTRTDASLRADLTLEKKFAEARSTAFIHLEAGKGEGLIDELALFSGTNAATADEEMTVTEAWYEQELPGGKAFLTFGELKPFLYFDLNMIADDETVEFVSDMFTNNAAIEFPGNTAGIRLGLVPWEWLELDCGVFDADGDFEEIGGDLFNALQANVKPGFLGLEGNYRFIAWRNAADHIRWSDPGRTGKATYGFAVSFDQRLTPELAFFFRYGWQDPRVYNPSLTAPGDLVFSLERSWSAGFQLKGAAWHRAKDRLGMALGQVIPSADYASSVPSLRAATEGHFEAYYNWKVNESLSVTPDYQYIWNPFGRDAGDASPVSVYSLRTQIDF